MTDSLFCSVFVFFPDLEGILCIKRGECFYSFHYNATASQTTFQGTWNFSLFWSTFNTVRLCSFFICLFVFNPINQNHTFKYDILLVCYILTWISNRRNWYRVCNLFALTKKQNTTFKDGEEKQKSKSNLTVELCSHNQSLNKYKPYLICLHK